MCAAGDLLVPEALEEARIHLCCADRSELLGWRSAEVATERAELGNPTKGNVLSLLANGNVVPGQQILRKTIAALSSSRACAMAWARRLAFQHLESVVGVGGLRLRGLWPLRSG
ncbi:hypothetical protein Acid345_0388 [Candidatus Koribacter versatilis Ellin345]|uniref:Uncharacterized protein n=1 Tax=Koribacter versatilis (strain Ellin345) TaxID=204669 RepID=Q1IUQ7_KORVE|nr:hypothetical protein Acid345_0388 [Candidatus Koribacter versatilis Ellin345]